MRKLARAWNDLPPGTVIDVVGAQEKPEVGVVLVDSVRFNHLERHEYFAAVDAPKVKKPRKSEEGE